MPEPQNKVPEAPVRSYYARIREHIKSDDDSDITDVDETYVHFNVDSISSDTCY